MTTLLLALALLQLAGLAYLWYLARRTCRTQEGTVETIGLVVRAMTLEHHRRRCLAQRVRALEDALLAAMEDDDDAEAWKRGRRPGWAEE